MPQNVHYWLMKQPPPQVRNMLLHQKKYLKSKKYLQRAKKLHQNWLLIRIPQTCTIGWWHSHHIRWGTCCFTKEVSKAKEISTKGQKAAPKLVVNQNTTKHALLADETATTLGEEHVASPPKVSKVKELSAKGQKAAQKLVAKNRVISQKASTLHDEGGMASDSDLDGEDYYIVENANESVYFGNYYNSPNLIDLLHKRKTHACGTVRKNQKSLSLAVTQAKLKQGETVFYCKNNLLALKWVDKREVYILSGLHMATNVISKKTNYKGQKVNKPQPCNWRLLILF